MERVSEGFKERLIEVDAYIDFLVSVEQSARHGPPKFHGSDNPVSAQQQKILYSTVYLQLYNLVESTMTRCIDLVVAAAANEGRWKPGDLGPSLRKEWVRVIAQTHTDLNPEHRLEKALLLCDHLTSSLPIDSFAIEKGGGGNWDDNAIEAISTRLGFQLHVSKPVYENIKRPFREELGPLALVKLFRNKLAHGSISFTECAENETVPRLVELKNKTVDYMQEVVACFEEYVERFEFLNEDRRPAAAQ